jgi:tetratricopeptide (TPR) repeat protein
MKRGVSESLLSLLLLAFVAAVSSGCATLHNVKADIFIDKLKAHHLAGNKYFNDGEYQKSIEEYARAIELIDSNSDICLDAEYVYLCSSDLKNIRNQLTHTTGNAYYNMAILNHKSKNYSLAVKNYKKAIEFNNRDADAYYWLAVLYGEMSESKLAKETFESFLNVAPEEKKDKIKYARSRVWMLSQVLNKAEGEEAKKREVEKEANNTSGDKEEYVEWDFSDLLEDTRPDFQAAYGKAVEPEKIKDPEFFFRQGVAYYEKGDYENAFIVLSNAIDLAPEFADAYFYRGIVQHMRGEYKYAIADYNVAYELNPDRSITLYNIALSYDELSDKENAADAFMMYLEVAPADNIDGIAYAEKRINEIKAGLEADKETQKTSESLTWDLFDMFEDLGAEDRPEADKEQN